MSDIQHDEIQDQGEQVLCVWFIPDTIQLDAQMLTDIGAKVWSRQVRAYHEMKLPGGSFINVLAFSFNPGAISPTEILRDYTESIDVILEIWEPSNPFSFLPKIKDIAADRWPITSGWKRSS